jgi:hypothetical protein
VKRGAAVQRAFLYDAAGNMTRDTRGATAYNYVINAAGRIRALPCPNYAESGRKPFGD